MLVVVLIIGILAAIALPQYKMAVGKAQFSTLKSLTKSLQQSAQRYYMLHNTYQGVNNSNFANLDIEKPEDSSCHITIENYEQVCSFNYNKQLLQSLRMGKGFDVCLYRRKD